MKKDLVIGIDIGGTKIAAGLFDSQGNFLARSFSNSHAGCPPDRVVDAVVASADALLVESGVSKSDIKGVGVGCAGHINFQRGVVLANSNLPDWHNNPLRETLQGCLKMPVILDNDANCAAWGEFRFGAGRGSCNMCYITFSTGCGMGIIINGKLYRGATGTAGEIGHTIVNPDGPLCFCGKRGCLMSYACGMALDRDGHECLKCGEDTLFNRLCGECKEHIPAEQIAEAARQGAPAALHLIETTGKYFGIGLSTVVEVLNPDTIVIGGGLSHIGHLLLDPCIESLNEHIQPVLVDSARIVMSELWNDAGVLGAGALVWEKS